MFERARELLDATRRVVVATGITSIWTHPAAAAAAAHRELTEAHPSHPTRTSDPDPTWRPSPVLIGSALIASAFSNLLVQVSGLVNVRLSRPGAPLVQIVLGAIGVALLLLGLARLFDPARHATAARPDESEGANPHHAGNQG